MKAYEEFEYMNSDYVFVSIAYSHTSLYKHTYLNQNTLLHTST